MPRHIDGRAYLTFHQGLTRIDLPAGEVIIDSSYPATSRPHSADTVHASNLLVVQRGLGELDQVSIVHDSRPLRHPAHSDEAANFLAICQRLVERKIDHPRRHTRTLPPGGIEEAHLFFRSLSHGYLAGHRDRPSGARLRRHFQSPDLSGLPLSHLWHVLACIRGLDLNRLLANGGLSLYEIARAIHLTGIRRISVTRWINQYAIRPIQ